VSKHISHWIGGKPFHDESERHGDVYDPATGQVDFAAGRPRWTWPEGVAVRATRFLA
jgi:hypothetical protein